MEQASSGLQRLMAGMLRELPHADAVVRAWPLACGPGVAAKTTAVDFVNGVLRVEVADAQWSLQLRELAAQYVAALNACAGHTVKRVTFVLPGEIAAMQDAAVLLADGKGSLDKVAPKVVDKRPRQPRNWMRPRR